MIHCIIDHGPGGTGVACNGCPDICDGSGRLPPTVAEHIRMLDARLTLMETMIQNVAPLLERLLTVLEGFSVDEITRQFAILSARVRRLEVDKLDQHPAKPPDIAAGPIEQEVRSLFDEESQTRSQQSPSRDS